MTRRAFSNGQGKKPPRPYRNGWDDKSLGIMLDILIGGVNGVVSTLTRKGRSGDGTSSRGSLRASIDSGVSVTTHPVANPLSSSRPIEHGTLEFPALHRGPLAGK